MPRCGDVTVFDQNPRLAKGENSARLLGVANSHSAGTEHCEFELSLIRGRKSRLGRGEELIEKPTQERSFLKSGIVTCIAGANGSEKNLKKSEKKIIEQFKCGDITWCSGTYANHQEKGVDWESLQVRSRCSTTRALDSIC